MPNYYYPPGYPLCAPLPEFRPVNLTPSYPMAPLPYVVSGPKVTGNASCPNPWLLPAAGLLALGAIGAVSYSMYSKNKSRRSSKTVSGNLSDLMEEEEEFEGEESELPDFARDID